MNDNEELAQRRKDKQIEQHKDLISKLKEELKSQDHNHKLVIARLEAEKDTWFTNKTAAASKVDVIMQVRLSVQVLSLVFLTILLVKCWIIIEKFKLNVAYISVPTSVYNPKVDVHGV